MPSRFNHDPLSEKSPASSTWLRLGASNVSVPVLNHRIIDHQIEKAAKVLFIRPGCKVTCILAIITFY